MSKFIKTLVGILGIGAAIYWSVLGVEFDDVMESFGDADILLIGAVLVMTSLNLIVRAAVWKAIVRPMKNVSLLNALATYLIGVFSNLFLPFKLGDVAQGYSLGRRTEISKISLVTAVLVQRVFEVTSLMLIMVLIATLFSFPLLFERQTVILGLGVIAAIVVLMLLVLHRERVVKWLEYLLKRFSPTTAAAVKRTFELFIEGTGAIQSFSDIVRVLGLSIVSWGIQITMVLLMARSLDIEISFLNASIVLLAINIGLLIPIAPGNIGTFQFFSILALSWFSVNKSKSLAFAILFQVIQGIPVIFGGGLSMIIEVFSSKTVKMNAKNTKNYS
ncbi:lysylphosphatidylglycerol synthase transmembrane domain-containing protein [Chitinispirillales bacterium ANBcel5]|uniref:lysylphosphatidylglycerol synthase transmembrane domain-containing protein n=1 Tax=Cellulosispirillum alkaliphilum TaxID=3039283 RepID=UPI002A5332F3|nr:lysylphosphatidylglycerol synthase transmembrane domain-containing protein [Chitinispirillales bacterium ANBcel5]